MATSLLSPLLKTYARTKGSRCPTVKHLRTVTQTLSASTCENKHLSHNPVMLQEVLKAMAPKENEVYIDMTFGAGGHTRTLLSSTKNIRVFGLDRDPVAYKAAEELSEEFPDRFIPLLGRFSDAHVLLRKYGVQQDSVDGILFDVGCSSMQFDDPQRGFALSKDGPLDMRMDGYRNLDQPTAADAVNTLDAHELARIFKVYGEEKKAKKIAQAIVEARYMLKRFNTTKELADFVAAIEDGMERKDKLQRRAHIATKVFQALRIFVNNELNELDHGLDIAHHYLHRGGRLVVLTFHSLEDCIVKRHIKDIDMNEPFGMSIHQRFRHADKLHSREDVDIITKKCWEPLYKKVLTPSEEEVMANPRSRSAKLRAAIKI